MPKKDYSFSNDLFGKLRSHFDIHTSVLMPTGAERVSAISYPPRSRAESL
ncbi:Hypothetical protein FKW44_025280 [Caligus rogercresseyi]|uniref:Uncharacterized protein n=1 Tax=Caligus rogercresseyi TaxID=217165 RepID=A0A7T8GKG2_CALRO|nr:Hypothetical protein FKW44_025280 [Caligus rogercresseyi]